MRSQREQATQASSSSQGTREINLGGTIRTCSPAETLKRLRPRLREFGITRVANVTGLDHVGIPVAVCIRPNARHLAVSQGKGISSELASISAIMESIELFHAEQAPEPERVASFSALSGSARVLDPRDLLPGIRWGAYSPEYQMRWIAGRELFSGDKTYLPHICLSMDSSTPHPDIGILATSTNGLASGNHPLEAVLHGIFEVVERDCEDRWLRMSAAEQDATRVDPSTAVDDPALESMLASFSRAQIVPHIWDITADTQLPAFRCILSDPSSGRGLGEFHGSGCHLNREVALARALSEAAQTRLTVISGSRDDIMPSHYEQRRQQARAREALSGGRDFRKLLNPRLAGTFEADLKGVLERLSRSGYGQVVQADLTRPAHGIPVCMTLIPGMNFVGARF